MIEEKDRRGLKPSSVPTALVGPILEKLIKDRWPYSEEDVEASGGELRSPYEILSEKAGCNYSTVERIVLQTNEGVDFDIFDRLLCAVGRPDIWRGELLDLYENIVFVQKCSLHSCSKTFPEAWFGRTKLYCSINCKVLAKKVADGVRPGNRFVVKGYCRSGRHKMTPENTLTQGNHHACRECNREKKRGRNARYNAKRRAAVTA